VLPVHLRLLRVQLATGEAYIIEVVGSDITPPDQLLYPTQNLTDDPFYVRLVFLNKLTCYNMSIIVPSMIYDHACASARN
jgi:hypothetical protein